MEMRARQGAHSGLSIGVGADGPGCAPAAFRARCGMGVRSGAAVPAQPDHGGLGPLGREARAARGGERRAGIGVGVDVLDTTAAAADEVAVVLEARVVERDAARRGDTPDEPELLEELEGRVDGRKRHVGQPLARLASKLLGGHVPVAFAQNAVEDEPLGRHSHGAVAKRGGEGGVVGLVAARPGAAPSGGVRRPARAAAAPIELVAVAWVRKRYLKVSLPRSLLQVTAGGIAVALVGFAVGHA
jgi:hypothetical protein